MPNDKQLKLVRLRRDNAYRAELPKHHRGTSSKCPPEAMGEEAMKTLKVTCESPDLLGVQH
jgi:hypothetical protein